MSTPLHHGHRRSGRQPFYVTVTNCDTGESCEVMVRAEKPENALSTVLRRSLFAEMLMSEETFRFRVEDEASANAPF